ncbi:bifunctional diguanylate cyclase/phosphodiesterase [Aquincola sp. S2]|uniref:Bifunctional diguanylate cyclase/phosphodiesterase n=1 Tax=Pseudaquabacterium terrae TaxID=2732868 RepID=A0ABX2ELT3_9BURK|nr:bifunctional diguanylate cyclase/phosphodiesterase [Aquabacterium terrae]NRF69630.1 bifunctional diguanylate cyclase/phosphodiesterase [Aquabacterium terrae]
MDSFHRWLGLGPALLLAVLAIGFALLYWRQRRAGRRLAASLEALTTRQGDSRLFELPGLFTRPQYDEAFDDAVRRCDRGLAELTLLFVDIDNFNSVNDAHGYDGGDQVIAEIAARLVDCAGPEAVLTRLGADEFLVLLPAGLNVARALAKALVAQLARPVKLGLRRQATLSGSIGIAAYPEHGSRARLVGHASTAMRCVKLAGGGDYMVFEPRMAVDTRDQAELLHDLRHAVANGELELFYQPKIDAQSLQITAAEALLRWHHPLRGLVSPGIFIPIAERYGLIGTIGQWVIDEASRQAADWRASGLRMRVAINISAYQMRQHDLVDRLVAALKTHGLQPGRFTCEITESLAMEDTRVTQRSFERMRRAGLHVSIDDFGVGQASLSYLRRLPAAELKIDGSFVRDLATSADARSIVDAVVKLAHALQLRVVAEGVETEAQRDLLVTMGCDELQGFLFARPMTARALTLWALDDGQRTTMKHDFRPSLFQETVPAPQSD